jgi:hypothetical protein
MERLVAIELILGAWGYIGKSSGQLEDKTVANVYLIGGEYQVWIPGLTRDGVREMHLVPQKPKR